MSLRLAMAGLFVPNGTTLRNLTQIEDRTNAALDGLIRQHSDGHGIPALDPVGTDLGMLRARMARGHRIRAHLLAEAVGEQRAVQLGREALFSVGTSLGEEARARLGLRPGSSDTSKAAKVLYRMLDIEMRAENGAWMMIVRHCALAKEYDLLTCQILSATDEGMISGLSGGARTRFIQHLTAGEDCCKAKIEWTGGSSE